MRGLAIVVAMHGLAACGGEPFVCLEDGQCSQSQEPGICVGGSCAYADPTCASQYRYAAGLDGALAGTCVPEDEVAGTGSGGSTGEPQTGESSSSASPPATGSDSSGSSVGEVDTGPVCEEDEYELGADTTFVVEDCAPAPEPAIVATLHAPDDEDRYTLVYGPMTCPELQHVTVVDSALPLQVCTFSDCAMEIIDCIDGTEPAALESGENGCCSAAESAPSAGFRDSACSLQTITIVVNAGTSCTPYTLVHGTI